MGISSIKIVSESAMLGLWEMTETWQELRASLNLSAKDLQTLSEKKTNARRQEWLACRALLKNMMQTDAEIDYHESGRPFIKGFEQSVSMSHSGAYACVYLDKINPTGVDIQKLKPSISKGADFFLNETELVWADTNDNRLLHIIWSAKEAVYKYAGLSELDFKKHLITNPFSSNQNDIIEVKLADENHTETVRVRYENFEDYVLTWTI